MEAVSSRLNKLKKIQSTFCQNLMRALNNTITYEVCLISIANDYLN